MRSHRGRPGDGGADGHPAVARRRGRVGGERRAGRDRRRVLHRASRRPASATTTYLLALTAIPAAVLGGLDSIAGAVVGGLMIGVSITFTAGYQDELSLPRPRPDARSSRTSCCCSSCCGGRPGSSGRGRSAVSERLATRAGAARWSARSSSCSSSRTSSRGSGCRPACSRWRPRSRAIGLTLLVGITGQLSLAHAFFVAVGAYGYCYLAGETPDPALTSQPERPRPADVAGDDRRRGARRARRARCSARSPAACAASTSAWPRSASCSSASTSCSTPPASPAASTAATRRRSACSASRFSDSDPDDFSVLGVPLRRARAAVVPRPAARRAVAGGTRATWSRSRPGRALQQVRDCEVAAAVMGVNVPVYKAAAFTVSSMYAGPRRRLPRARVRAHRARVLRLPVLDRLPRDDRASAGSARSAARSPARCSSPRCRRSSTTTATRCRWSPSRAAAACRRRRPRASSTAPRSSPS